MQLVRPTPEGIVPAKADSAAQADWDENNW
jgi:hypothetical protein